MSDEFEKHISLKQDALAVDCLADALPFSRQKIKQLLQSGAVWHETARGIERIRRAKRKLHAGDKLHVYYNQAVQEETPKLAQLIDDRGEYSIWYKPSGMLSQGSKWGDHTTLYRWAETHLQPQRPAFIVHRLDKATSGLMVLAHSKSMASSLSHLFETREVKKKYQARVEGHLQLSPLPFVISAPVNDKAAITHVLSLAYDKNKNLTEVLLEIKTGRKHQIRQHLSTLGHPVEGDRLYGANNVQVDLQLCCIELGFICPVTGNELSWSWSDKNKQGGVEK